MSRMRGGRFRPGVREGMRSGGDITMMHGGLWRQLDGLDPADVARRSACAHLPGGFRFDVFLLGRCHEVDVPARSILPVVGAAEACRPAGYLEQLCILAYLIHSRDEPPVGRLVSAEELPGGQFFFRGPHTLPTARLVEKFGEEPVRLQEAAVSLKGRRLAFGDSSVEIPALARVPLTFVVWAGNEEFPARASVLFDGTADRQLPLDALMALVELTVKALAG